MAPELAEWGPLALEPELASGENRNTRSLWVF
jgi:hypothetical protein